MESVGFDDCSFYGSDSISLRQAFESILSGFGPLESAETLYQTEEECYGKRYADSMLGTEYPQRKRARKISIDFQDDYANMLLKEASLPDDISVTYFGPVEEEEISDFHLDGIEQIFADFAEPKDDLMDYLQVLF